MKVGDVVSVYADVEGACLRGYQKSYHGTTVFVGNGVACLDRTTLFGGLHSDKLRLDTPPEVRYAPISLV